MMSHAVFPDVDLDHPWVKDYRVPFMYGLPVQNYFVVLQVPLAGIEEDRSTIMMPTEDEVKIISSYIDFKVSNYGYTKHFESIVRQRPLDIDDIVNTITLKKWRNETWAYSMATWTMHGPKPFMDEKKFADIVDLLDLIEKDWTTDSVRPAWAAWKAEHEIFNR
jgi:hypothetical protein